MVFCMAGFAFNDAAMKALAGDMPLFQAVFLRGMIATVLIVGLAWSQNALRFETLKGNMKATSWRTLGELGGTVCFLTALFNMPLANVTAIMQAMPLAITLAAAIFLGEVVGWRRMLAILIGFAGVVIIVRPGSDGFNIFAIVALCAMFFITLRDLATRSLSKDVPSLLIAVITSVAVMVASGLASIWEGWVSVSLEHMGYLSLAALFLMAGYAFSVMCMRVGDVAFVAPFRYTILLWAILLGYLVFDDVPDLATWIGSAIIVATGLFTFWREQRVAAR